MKICVITKVPPEDEEGNKYTVVGYVWGSPHLPQYLQTFEQNCFELGEVLFLENNYGREVNGKGRKPSKWSVETQMFEMNQLEEALELAIRVTRES